MTNNANMNCTKVCPWNGEDGPDEPNTDKLCRWHLAEYEGLSVNELDRMESEQAAEYDDCYGERDSYWYRSA